MNKERLKKKKKWPGGGRHLDYVMCLVCPQLKLEDYKKRLSQGEALNRDQMVRPGNEMVTKM